MKTQKPHTRFSGRSAHWHCSVAGNDVLGVFDSSNAPNVTVTVSPVYTRKNPG